MKIFVALFVGILIGLCAGALGFGVKGRSTKSSTNEWTEGENASPLVTDIEKEVSNPLSPIKFDPKVNEYQLVYGFETNEIAGSQTNAVRYTFYCPIRFNPWTGNKLPPSTRPNGVLIDK